MKQKLSNTALSNIISDILIHYKIEHICICPGSRNTPLTLSFTKNKKFKCTSYIDERSAGFFTLGIAKSLNQPSVVLTTSGTSVANLLPSIIEADLSRTPMIAITADRPKSLLNTGENQTIKQNNIFKNFIRDSIHIDLSDNNSIENIYAQLDSAINKSIGSIGKNSPGPVHINISFDEPLIDKNTSYEIDINLSEKSEYYNNFMLPKCNYPIIICGQLNTDSQSDMIISLSEKLNCPILTDPLSQLRFDKKHPHIFSYYDYYIENLSIKPDYIIRFGSKPVSKKLNKFLNSYKNTQIILLSEYAKYNDDSYVITVKDINGIETLNQHNKNLLNHITDLEHKSRKILKKYYTNEYFFEGNILYQLLNQFKNNDNLFIGNSLPVRTLEKFCPNLDKKIMVHSNRGASGIDGLIATAIGTAHSHTSKTNLILGDISFFYDSSSLLIANKYKIDINIIIINNKGGQIFSKLPYAKNNIKNFEEFWTTPVDLSIKKISQLYKANYTILNSIEKINKQLKAALKKSGINIIEILCDFNKTLEIEQKIEKEF